MTTPACTVCGAAEPPGRDHTCPVCGADLPGAPTPAPGEWPASTPDHAADAPRPDPPSSHPGPPAGEAPPPPPTWSTGSGPVPPPPPAWPATSARPAPSPYDPSHPSGLSSSVRTHGVLTHLSSFLGAVVALAFIGPLVMWLVRRDEHPFLDHHGKEALNFNLSMLLYFVIGVVASLATLGLGLVVVVPVAFAFFVTWVVTTIVGAVRANAGEGYRYPLTIRFIPD